MKTYVFKNNVASTKPLTNIVKGIGPNVANEWFLQLKRIIGNYFTALPELVVKRIIGNYLTALPELVVKRIIGNYFTALPELVVNNKAFRARACIICTL